MAWRNSCILAALGVALVYSPVVQAQDTTPSGEDQQGTPTQEAAAEEDTPAADDGNDQNWVLGFGFGSHAFDTPLRAGAGGSSLEVISAFMSQLFAEWYVFDTLGVGARFITFGEKVTASTTVTIGASTTTSTYEANLSVDTLLATVHWVPLGGNRYARMGVLAGVGSSSYEFVETYNPGMDATETTSGPAALAGVYVDWGADGFGARFGMQMLSAKLGEVNGRSVDASGREIHLDLRWAY